ncbi:MAG: glycosyltransferase family 4 protein [Prevotellaceae bacterium]|jgi:glycosyltransferase involved in cell wall biosynthesis|nr:glycosyltransferase family 4 protein [Prevotellaceae bacterium]
MKILFFTAWYPTEKNPNFGIFIKEHVKAVQTTENEVVVLAIVIHRGKGVWKKTTKDFIDENGVRTILIEITTCFRDIVYLALPLQYWIVKRIFRKLQPAFEPDIVHSNVILPAGIIGGWLAEKMKKPHIITEHFTGVEGVLKMPVISRWAKKAYQRTVYILPVSAYLKENLIKLMPLLENNNFQVIPNVVDGQQFLYKEKKPLPDTITLCSIAAWNRYKKPAKQPELLIDAVSILQKEIDKKMVLLMVGGGNKLEELKERCKEKNVNVIFTGYLDKKDIVKNLHQADFFAHPTLIETFGVVVVEALSTGTPVICSNDKALRELINEQNGVLCENTVEDWVNGIRQAIHKKFDGKEIANNVSQKYSYEKVGTKIDKIYHSI